MKREELLEELRRIVRDYLPSDDGEELANQVDKDNVRFVLLQLEQKKEKPLTKEDEDILAEVSFNFA